MSEYVQINGIKNLYKALERNQKNIIKAVDKAKWNTAQKAVRPIKKRVPVAFGELRDSVQAFERGDSGNPTTSVTAPHAGSVEIGSPPHTPNFERLVAWVKLRGMQDMRGGPRKLGPTGALKIASVRKMFGSHVIAGAGGKFSPVDAPEQIARAISKGIEKHGTKPHWYVRESLPEIQVILGEEIRKGLSKVGGK